MRPLWRPDQELYCNIFLGPATPRGRVFFLSRLTYPGPVYSAQKRSIAGKSGTLWFALLTNLVGLEKILPRQSYLSRGTGVLLAGWGIWMLFSR